MEDSMLRKLVSNIKPGQEFLITYVSPVDTTKEFRELSGGCTIGKMTGVRTVTGMNYGELDAVKKAREEREAKVAAGEAKPVQQRVSPYEPEIPGTLYRGKKNGKLYLALYPTECWKKSFSTYGIFSPDGELEEQYDSWEEIRDYVSPRWAEKHTAPANGQSFNLQPFIPKPADRIYDIMVGGYGESLREDNQNYDEDDEWDTSEVDEKINELSDQCYQRIINLLCNYAVDVKLLQYQGKGGNEAHSFTKTNIIEKPILYSLVDGRPMSGGQMIDYILEHIQFTLDGTLKGMGESLNEDDSIEDHRKSYENKYKDLMAKKSDLKGNLLDNGYARYEKLFLSDYIDRIIDAYHLSDEAKAQVMNTDVYKQVDQLKYSIVPELLDQIYDIYRKTTKRIPDRKYEKSEQPWSEKPSKKPHGNI